MSDFDNNNFNYSNNSNNNDNNYNIFEQEGAARNAAPYADFREPDQVRIDMGNPAPQSSPVPSADTGRKRNGPPFWAGILIGVGGALLIFFLMLVPVIRLLSPAGSSSGDRKYEEKIDTILSYINDRFLWEVDEDTIEEGLADGLMASLGDKYAVYYTPEEYSDLMESVSGEYAGIGVSIIMNEDNKIEVYKVFRGSPAEAAGIIVKDLIVEAGGVTEFPALEDLVSVVRGTPGTDVDIVIERDGKRIPMTVTRANVLMDTVSWRMLEDDIGYIHIEEFDNVTLQQFNEALDDLNAQGMKAVIFDLRDNPGGDYDTVVAMCDRVLPEGVIMTVKDRNGTIKTENSDQESRIDLPMAVIINGNSASASEVFTGAIQDYNIATIVGEQSFGKGIVQSIYSLADGSGIKFTTMEYFTPSGDSINGVGITPDIVVELPEDVYDDGVLTDDEDTQLQAAIDALK